jgi:signal transduction histidine kinase
MDKTPRKILLIEDNPGDDRLIREYLSQSRYGIFKVDSTSRLATGLEALDKSAYDLILLDPGLPDSQGVETLNRIKEKANHLPIVILTGQNDEALGIRAVAEGAQDYLVKDEVNSSLLTRTLSYAIERKRVETLLLNYQSRLRSLAVEVTLAEERERRRIATDLHDNISQILAFCTMKLSLLIKSQGAAGDGVKLQEIYDGLQQIAAATRSLTFELSPPELYDFGLEAAVRGLCERMAREHGLPIYFEADNNRKDMENDRRIALFRMIRELLTNAIKHAGASYIRVTLARSGRKIKIAVEDDGAGFDTKILNGGNSRGFGLFSIRDSLQYMGGQFEVDSHRGKGSRFIITVPLQDKLAVSPGEKI